MTVILIIGAILIVTGLLLWLHDRYSDPRTGRLQSDTTADSTEESECCGMHITCEKDSLLAAVSAKVEYYDDEELDQYKGRNADDYSDEEIEQFRDVLLTLLPQDIAGWARSIQLRGIRLPAVIKEELLMIVAEARQKSDISQK